MLIAWATWFLWRKSPAGEIETRFAMFRSPVTRALSIPSRSGWEQAKQVRGIDWFNPPAFVALWYIARVPAKKPDDRQFKVGDKVRVNLHHGKIEDAVVRAVIEDGNETKLQVDVVGLDLTALIDTQQVVE